MSIPHAVFDKVSLHEDIAQVLVDEPSIRRRVRELGDMLNREYVRQDLLLVSVLKGSIIFMADLIRAITIPHEIDFMATSSYGAGTSSSAAASGS